MTAKVRTFHGATMRAALERVKRELGAEAVILGTRSVPAGGVGRLVGQNRVEITAGPPATASPAPRCNRAGRAIRPAPSEPPIGAQRVRPASRPATEAYESAKSAGAASPHVGSGGLRLGECGYAYFVQLVQREVGEQLAARLVREAAEAAGGNVARRPEVLEEMVRAAIARMVPVAGGIKLDGECCRRVALIGAAGAGKTTTLAKLAAHFKLREHRRVSIVSLDMHRMATHEQLRRYAEIIDVPMYEAQTVRGAREAASRTQDAELVLIDTPGMGFDDRGRFVRLGALLRAARAEEVHLVLPVSLASTIQRRAAEAFGPLGVGRVVLTRLDEAVGLGVVLNALEHLRWSLSYLTDGQKVPNDIQEACGERVAELVLGSAN